MSVPARSIPPVASKVDFVKDWLTDRLLRGLIWLAMLLPHEKRVPFMGWLVRILGRLIGYRRRAIQNLTMIWPDMPEAEKNRIATGVLDNFGRTLIENYSFRSFGKTLASATVSGEGLAAVQKARDEGRPVIFVTGHFGNHEAPRQWLTNQGYLIGGLYRPMQNRFTNDHYARTMTELSGPVFKQGRKGTMGFARHLKDSGFGTLLFDVRVAGGQWIDFLGHPARTALSAAEMALKFDALLVPYWGIRQPDGLGFEIAIEAPVPPSDALEMTTELTRRLESRVRANPDQWFWVHRRWKP